MWVQAPTPSFLKWNGDKGTYSRRSEPYFPRPTNSWGIITAASTMGAQHRHSTRQRIVKAAWNDLMCGQTSCYWYWDCTRAWDSKPATRPTSPWPRLPR